MHPYRQLIPETVQKDVLEEFKDTNFLLSSYQSFSDLVATFDSTRRILIVSSEWGYQGTGDREIRQAEYAVRQFLTNLSLKVPVSIWYDWREGNKNDNNFGILHADFSPKPAYYAIQMFGGSLRGFRFTGRIAVSESDYVLRFERAGFEPRYVAWTTGDPHRAKVTLAPGARYEILGMLGQRVNKSRTDNKGLLSIELSSSPVYLFRDLDLQPTQLQ